MSGAVTPAAVSGPAAGSFVPLSPARVLDTRTGNGAPKAAVLAGQTTTVQIRGRGGVPANAGSVVVNLTVTAGTGSGYLSVFAGGAARPATSNLNYTRGQTVANSAIAPIGADGTIDIYLAGTGAAQLIVDVSGYIVAGTPAVAGGYGTLTPTRLLDTGTGTGAPKAPVTAGSILRLRVIGRGGIPADNVRAIALTVTAVGGTAAGFVSVYADGAPVPVTSSLNYRRGQTVANLVIVPVGTYGDIDVRLAGSGTARLIADVAGYVTSGTPSTQALSVLPAARILDTRSGNGAPKAAVAAGHTLTMQVTGRGGVPATGVGAAVLNLTTTAATGDAYLTSSAAGVVLPVTSSLNYLAGQTVANLVVVPVSADGTIAIHLTGTGTAQLIADVSGYVTAAPLRPVTWGAPQQAEPFHGYVNTVSCASTTFCLAGDQRGDLLRYNGTTWSAPAPLSAPRSITAISCVSTTFCMAFTGAGTALRFDGTTWTSYVGADSSGRQVSSISCVSPTFCVAVDAAGYAVTFNGSTWSSPVPDEKYPTQPVPLGSVSCTSTTFCVAVFGDTARAFNGTAWTTEWTLQGTFSLEQVSCVSSVFCVAVGSANSGGAAAQTFDGTTWSASAVSGQTLLTSVSCTSVSFCVAGGAGTSSFDGTAWSSPVPLKNEALLTALSCAGTTCVTIDRTTGNAWTYTGGTWSTPTLVDTVSGLSDGLSCPTLTFCAQVDDKGTATTFDGSTWSAPAQVGSRALLAVSCVSATFCVTANVDGYGSVYNGTSWSALAPTVSGAGGVISLSCSSTTFCLALTVNGGTAIFDGHSWTDAHATVPDTAAELSCTGPDFCAAVAGNHVTTFNGVRWTASVSLPNATNVETVTCTSAYFCLAADVQGGVYSYNGAGWSGPTEIESGQYIHALSCASSYYCVAADNGGGSFVYNGTNWTGRSLVGTSPTVEGVGSVSCSTTGCVLVTTSDRAFVGSA